MPDNCQLKVIRGMREGFLLGFELPTCMLKFVHSEKRVNLLCVHLSMKELGGQAGVLFTLVTFPMFQIFRLLFSSDD